jgi:hypothetical protein
MLGWALDVVLPWAPPPWLVGPACAAVLLALPGTRHRLLARPAPGWGAGANLGITAALLVAVGWMTSDQLRYNPLDPGPTGHTYYFDTTFQVAVMGELRHSLWPEYPPVHGDPYSYHWFLHAITVHLTTGTDVDPFDSMLRLVPTTLFPAVVLLSAVVARRIAGTVRAGVICAALLTVTGATVATVWSTDGQAPLMVQTYWSSSLTSALGWLPTVAVAGCVVAILRRSPADSAVPTRLFLPLVLLAAGTKSADLTVLLGGTTLALGALVLTRRWTVVPRAVVVNVLLGGVLLIAQFTMYGDGDYGLQLSPGGAIRQAAATLFPGTVRPSGSDEFLALPYVPIVPLLAAAVFYLAPLVPRFIGFVPLLRRATARPGDVAAAGYRDRRFRRDAGLPPAGNSNIYFLVAAYPVGLIGSAWGVSELRPRHAAAWAGGALGVALTLVVAWFAGATPPVSISGRLAPLTALAAALAAAGLIAFLIMRRAIAVVMTFAILERQPDPCTAKLFDFSAFAQRDVDVEKKAGRTPRATWTPAQHGVVREPAVLEPGAAAPGTHRVHRGRPAAAGHAVRPGCPLAGGGHPGPGGHFRARRARDAPAHAPDRAGLAALSRRPRRVSPGCPRPSHDP